MGADDLKGVGVEGERCAWLPLQFWADGSVRVAQLQFTDVIASETVQTYDVLPGQSTVGGEFRAHPWTEAARGRLSIQSHVKDTFGVDYRATVSGDGVVLQETPLVQTRRFRTYHTASSGGIGRDYLTATFYVTEFYDMPFIIVDWVLGNDYLGKDGVSGSADPNMNPLGIVDVDLAEFVCDGVTEAVPYLKPQHGVADWVVSGGRRSAKVMEDTYLADGQTRRYRFLLRFEDGGASQQQKDLWRQTFNAFSQDPLYPLADIASWQDSEALGLHGGPIRGPSDARQRAQGEYATWIGRNHFGTWGTFGDVKITSTTGTPRNTTVSEDLAHAIQGGYGKLVQALEQKAWAQAVRPYHLFGLQVGAEENILLWDGIPYWPGSRDLSNESLGRRGLWANDPYAAYRTRWSGGQDSHGWSWYDIEHWTTDLLFDYWSVTGDAWAREELRQLGESLKATLRLHRYATATTMAPRAEGWCMVSFVQCYLATQDDALKQYAMRRTREIVDPGQFKSHPSRCLMMHGTYAGTGYGPNHKYVMPYQYGPILYGFLAANRFFEDDVALRIAEDVPTLVEYSWVTNVNDPLFGFVANGLRYYVPTEVSGQAVAADYFDNDPNVGRKFGDSPLGGAHIFLRCGLMLLAQRTANRAIADKAEYYGKILFGNLSDGVRWSKWSLVVRDEWWQ